MYFLVILAFLGQITGETFFYHNENEHFTLACNKTETDETNETVWYEADIALQKFHNKCSASHQETNKGSDNTECTNRLSVSSTKSGGVFACRQFTITAPSQSGPLFTNVTDCRQYNFFIVATINMTAESETFENISGKSHGNFLVQEGSNITVPCEFQMKSEKPFLVYWIKYKGISKCLSSVQKEQGDDYSYNQHCCIDEKVKERLLNKSINLNKTHIAHDLIILNATNSDSGTYLCLVNMWSKGKHVWKIASNHSIEVRSGAIPPSVAYVITGLIGGIILISGVTWWIYNKKKNVKSKGKPSAQLPRAQAAIEMPSDECEHEVFGSPYAVSSSQDLQRNEKLDSLATSPYEDPDAGYCTVDNTSVSGKRPADEMRTVYALVQK